MRSYFAGRAAGRVDDVVFPGDEVEYRAALYHPANTDPGPAWVITPGLSALGSRHPTLVRMAHSFAAAGYRVLTPEVPSLSALRVDSGAMRDVAEAGVHYLAGRTDIRPGAVGVLGFSLCGTQALAAAAGGRLHGRIAAVASAGGYYDLPRTFRFGFTGEHDWDGQAFRWTPNPYGRWIACRNFLTAVPGYGDMDAVARRVGHIAEEASRRTIAAGDPAFDPLNTRLRAELGTARERELWDLIAPLSGALPPDRAAAVELADGLAKAALGRDPGIAVSFRPGAIRPTVLLAHGRGDDIIPYTETLRLARALGDDPRPETHVMGLYAHSVQATLRPDRYVRGAWGLLRLIRRLCEVV